MKHESAIYMMSELLSQIKLDCPNSIWTFMMMMIYDICSSVLLLSAIFNTHSLSSLAIRPINLPGIIPPKLNTRTPYNTQSSTGAQVLCSGHNISLK